MVPVSTSRSPVVTIKLDLKFRLIFLSFLRKKTGKIEKKQNTGYRGEVENSIFSYIASANMNCYVLLENNLAAWLTIKIHIPLAQESF